MIVNYVKVWDIVGGGTGTGGGGGDGGDPGSGSSAAPSQPGSFCGSIYSQTAAELFWDRSTDKDGYVAYYELERDGQTLFSADRTSWFMDDLSPGTEYYFQLRAFDDDGNSSAPINTQLRTPSNNVAEAKSPCPPSNFSAVKYSDTALGLSWDTTYDYEGTRILRYKVRQNGQVIFDGDSTGIFLEGRSPGVEYTYTITAIDKNLRASPPSTIKVVLGSPN